MKTTSQQIAKEFEGFLNMKRAEYREIFAGMKCAEDDPFADVRYYTDKKCVYIHNDDVSKGWTGVMTCLEHKTKHDSHILLAVTYDGAGYDEFNYEGMNYAEKFEEYLRSKGYKVKIEHCTNWAFEVYRED